MHSIRMRAARSLPHRRWRVSVQGGLCLGGLSPGGLLQADPPDRDPLPPVDRTTDGGKNITLPQTLFASSNDTLNTIIQTYNLNYALLACVQRCSDHVDCSLKRPMTDRLEEYTLIYQFIAHVFH